MDEKKRDGNQKLKMKLGEDVDRKMSKKIF